MFKTTFKILVASSAMVSAIAIFSVDADAADARRLSAMKASPAHMKAARGRTTVRRTLPNKIARTTGRGRIKGLSARVKSGSVGLARKPGNSRMQIGGKSRVEALQKFQANRKVNVGILNNQRFSAKVSDSATRNGHHKQDDPKVEVNEDLMEDISNDMTVDLCHSVGGGAATYPDGSVRCD